MQINDTQFLKLANSVHALIDFPLFNPNDGYLHMTKTEKLEFLLYALTSHVGNEYDICPECLEVMDEDIHIHGKQLEFDDG